MPSAHVVKAVDVFEHCVGELLASSPRMPPDQFSLQCFEECFGYSVLCAPYMAHGAVTGGCATYDKHGINANNLAKPLEWNLLTVLYQKIKSHSLWFAKNTVAFLKLSSSPEVYGSL